MNSAFECVIGLEIHAQLMTQSKAFCFAPAEFGRAENSTVGTVSAGLPGALPVLNKTAVELAIRAGIALNCKINLKSEFARKNYFYPDLPKGYQISQFDRPLCGEGSLEIETSSGKKTIEIERIHMEEDAGKSQHIADSTLVNLNRAGVALVEIVSKPVIHSAEEAVAYLKKVHSILVFANITDGNMEEGNFRCDVNISVRPKNSKKLGTRTEIKNVNSFRFVEKAIEYESARQIALIQNGGSVTQETRGWDAAADKTFAQRSKEEAHDYRYFPDPDLPPLCISEEWIQSIRENMPELPDGKRSRFIQKYALSEYDATQLTSDAEWALYFEECLSLGAPAKQASNWILSELLREIKSLENSEIKLSPVSPAQLTELILLIENKTLSGKMAKKVFQDMFRSGSSAKQIVEEQGLQQVTDPGSVEAWIREVLQENATVAEEFRQGKEKVLAFLMGQVMKKSQGQANPTLVTELLKKVLKGT